jgi:glutaredoxin
MIAAMQNSPLASSAPRPRASWSALQRHLLVLGLALASLGCGAANSETSTLVAEGQPVVEVFVTDWCPYCQRLEAFLKQNKVAYQRKNIEQSAEFRAQHAELGGGGIPVTRINGNQVIRGFRPDAIAEAIGLKTKSSELQSSEAERIRPSTSRSPSRNASAASCLLSPMSVTRTS